MKEKTTLVLGASPKPERFSHRAVKKLVSYGIPVIAIGLREGVIGEVKIQKPFPELSGIHTITIYIGPKNQPRYYDYILKTGPERVIFNPGTANEEFGKMLKDSGIEVAFGCTLMMLDNGTY